MPCSFMSWSMSSTLPFRRFALLGVQFALLGVLTLARLACAQQPPAVFALDAARESVVSLDSGWRFHPGDDADWSDPGYDDSTWKLLRADKPWSEQGYPGMSGYGWYRFSLRVPPAQGKGQGKLALELAPIMTYYQLFFDGHIAGQVGTPPSSILPSANWNYAIYPLPELPVPELPVSGPLALPGMPEIPSGQERTIHVAIRVWHSPIWANYLGGGTWAGRNLFGSAALLDKQQQAHWDHHRLLFVDLFCYAIAATIIGLTILALYLFRPREHEYLWFALLLLVKAADAALNISKELYAFPPIPIFDLLDAVSVAVAQAALVLFLANVLRLGQRGLVQPRLVQRRMRIVLLALIALSPLLNMLYWPGWASVPVSALLQILCLLPSAIWMLSILAEGAVRRDETARLLLVPVLLVQGLWVVKNVLVAFEQFGKLQNDLALDTPIIVAPYRLHPTILAELVFLLAMLIFLIRRFTAGRQREERFENELEAARQVHQIVLPARIEAIPGFATECIYAPSELVGGDFFQILPTPGGGLLIVAGDVAGKGLPAALMVSMLVGIIRAEATHTSDPAALLTAMNESLCGHAHSRFTTCLCLHIDVDGNVRAANAGHLNPYRDGQEIPTEPALPLGILPGAQYTLTRFALGPGERLTIVSDGVLEAQSREGELFGFERTSAISRKSAAEIAQTARDFGQNDDITVLTIAYLGSGAALAASPASKSESPATA